MRSSTTPDVGRRFTARDDELRFANGPSRSLPCSRDAGLRGRSVADVGLSPEMIRAADAKGAADVQFQVARAEELPFAHGTFERGLMRHVAHHVGRGRTFPEPRRVLVPGGASVLEGIDPDGLAELWYVRLFPPLLEREGARIPSVGVLHGELQRAGFRRVPAERPAVERPFECETAVRTLRGRHASSVDLLTTAESEEGLARAEAERAGEAPSTLRSLLAGADAH